MKPIILSIDTTNSQVTFVTLTISGKKEEYKEVTDFLSRSQNVLPLIDRALKQSRSTFANIIEIQVNSGPGSFTGTRVGVSIANAFGWSLGVPVNGKKIEIPQYEKSKFD